MIKQIGKREKLCTLCGKYVAAMRCSNCNALGCLKCLPDTQYHMCPRCFKAQGHPATKVGR